MKKPAKLYTTPAALRGQRRVYEHASDEAALRGLEKQLGDTLEVVDPADLADGRMILIGTTQPRAVAHSGPCGLCGRTVYHEQELAANGIRICSICFRAHEAEIRAAVARSQQSPTAAPKGARLVPPSEGGTSGARVTLSDERAEP